MTFDCVGTDKNVLYIFPTHGRISMLSALEMSLVLSQSLLFTFWQRADRKGNFQFEKKKKTEKYLKVIWGDVKIIAKANMKYIIMMIRVNRFLSIIPDYIF